LQSKYNYYTLNFVKNQLIGKFYKYKYSKEELIEKDPKLASMMLFEKCKTKGELKNEIIEMLLLAQSKPRISWIQKLIKYVFVDKLREERFN